MESLRNLSPCKPFHRFFLVDVLEFAFPFASNNFIYESGIFCGRFLKISLADSHLALFYKIQRRSHIERLEIVGLDVEKSMTDLGIKVAEVAEKYLTEFLVTEFVLFAQEFRRRQYIFYTADSLRIALRYQVCDNGIGHTVAAVVWADEGLSESSDSGASLVSGRNGKLAVGAGKEVRIKYSCEKFGACVHNAQIYTKFAKTVQKNGVFGQNWGFFGDYRLLYCKIYL